jgi:hypothetical protein
MASIVPLDMEDLGNQVRHWVHFDNLLNDLNKQINDTRKKRNAYEMSIINTLNGTKYEKAVLQIAGGRLLVAEERHNKPLTFTSLELMLHEYYRQKASPGNDETAEIIKFIKGHRSLEINKRLKRQ